MLKIVVLDGGYGGELFADKLEEELPVANIIRVIDWRNADSYLKSPRRARRTAIEALRPYIGRVDLVVLANHLLSATSLKFFRRKFKDQKFVGLDLPRPTTFVDRPIVVLSTKSLTHTINYHNYLFHLKRKADTICLDDWPGLIDDGELGHIAISKEFDNFYAKRHYRPQEVILTCSQFNDIIPELRSVLGKNIKIHDSFPNAIKQIGKILKIRGGTGKRKH